MLKSLKSIISENNCTFIIGYDEDPPFLFSRHWEIIDENEGKIGIACFTTDTPLIEAILQGKPVKLIFLDCSGNTINYKTFKAKAFLIEDKEKLYKLREKYKDLKYYIVAKIIEEL